ISQFPPLSLSGFFFCDLRVDAPLDQLFPGFGLLSGFLKCQFAVGAKGSPRRGAVAGIAGHKNEGPASRFGNANAKPMNVSVPGVVMTTFVLKTGIPLETFDLSIGEIPPDHHRPSPGDGLATKTVCLSVAGSCQRVADVRKSARKISDSCGKMNRYVSG